MGQPLGQPKPLAGYPDADSSTGLQDPPYVDPATDPPADASMDAYPEDDVMPDEPLAPSGVIDFKDFTGFMKLEDDAAEAASAEPHDFDNAVVFQAREVVGPGLYYIGIVDCITAWTWSKRLERLFKVLFKCNDEAGISCVPPQPYASRFQQKVRQIIEHDFIRQVSAETGSAAHSGNPAFDTHFTRLP